MIARLEIWKLLSYASSHEGVGWTVSAVVHTCGALAASAALIGSIPNRPPLLLGQTNEAHVRLQASFTEPSPPPRKAMTEKPLVLVVPKQARPADRVRLQADVAALRPVAIIERSLAPPPMPELHRQDQGPESTDLSRTEAAPLPRVARQPRAIHLDEAHASAVTSSPEHVAVGDGGRTPPQLLSNRPPEYPEEALRNRQQGIVILRVSITATGDVLELKVLSSSGHAILDTAATEAVGAWRFVPAQHDGQPVPATVRLPVRFVLQ